MHTAVAALIPFWWLNLTPPKKLLERTVRGDRAGAAAERPGAEVPHQADAAKATALGIKLTELPRCKWDTT